MNAAEVVELLKNKGIIRTQSAIKRAATKYNLYNDVDSPRPGLDPKKISRFVNAVCSPLRVSKIAHEAGCSYSKVNYYIMKYRIATRKEFGIILLKNKKDLSYVKSNL